MRLDQLPRVQLAQLPTPLMAAPRLTAAIGGPRVWLKRDDLTGLGLGGNKAKASLSFCSPTPNSSGPTR